MSKSKSEPPKRAVDLLLDSGAFSAFTRGVKIDLGEYIEFVRANLPLLLAHVNLDVIPGRPGGTASPAEVEEAAAASFKNYEVMRRAGLAPIPVFHMGESEGWLRRILDSGAEWIGLGGSVGKPDEARHQFFRRSFRVIEGAKRRVKVHGFGATTISTMLKFPWYSVDSTSWVMASAMGSILVPAIGARGLDYTQLTAVRVSGQGGQARQAAGLGDLYHRHLTEFLKSEGLNLARVRNNQYDRNYINIRSMSATAKAAGVRLFFSTWIQAAWDQGVQLTLAKASSRLISYYEISMRPDRGSRLQEYVAAGALTARPREFSFDQFDLAAYRGRRITALVAREELDASSAE